MLVLRIFSEFESKQSLCSSATLPFHNLRPPCEQKSRSLFICFWGNLIRSSFLPDHGNICPWGNEYVKGSWILQLVWGNNKDIGIHLQNTASTVSTSIVYVEHRTGICKNNNNNLKSIWAKPQSLWRSFEKTNAFLSLVLCPNPEKGGGGQ